MEKTIPKNYFLVQQTLSALKAVTPTPWMTWGDYTKLIQGTGLTASDVTHVTDFLVTVGDVALAPSTHL